MTWPSTSDRTVARPDPGTDIRALQDADATLVDLLDRVLERGVTVTGDIVLSVAGIDLVHVGVRLVLKGLDGTEGDA